MLEYNRGIFFFADNELLRKNYSKYCIYLFIYSFIRDIIFYGKEIFVIFNHKTFLTFIFINNSQRKIRFFQN